MTKARTEGAPAPDFLTVDEAAARLRQSPKTVRRRITAGEIAAHRFGRSIRVCERDLDVYIKARRS